MTNLLGADQDRTVPQPRSGDGEDLLDLNGVAILPCIFDQTLAKSLVAVALELREQNSDVVVVLAGSLVVRALSVCAPLLGVEAFDALGCGGDEGGEEGENGNESKDR